MEPGARCALHPSEPAELACARCGAFTCAACTASPSVLCAPCQERLAGAKRDWADPPRPPPLLVRIGLGLPAQLTVASLLLLGPRWVDDVRVLYALALLGLLVMALGVVRLVQAALYRRGRRRIQEGLRLMRQQRNAAAAVAFEETLRTERLGGAERALALWLHAACVSSLGHHARARPTLEALTPSPWRSVGTMRLLRGPGQILLAVTRALDGDPDGAAAARAAFAPSWIQRRTYSPAYGDALLALRAGRAGPAVAAHLAVSRAFAARLGDDALANSTALLEGFHAERMGASEAQIETLLAPARRAPAEVAEGLSRHWPALASFVSRRLRARESPLTPETPLR
jgi:hypothetical protein